MSFCEISQVTGSLAHAVIMSFVALNINIQPMSFWL